MKARGLVLDDDSVDCDALRAKLLDRLPEDVVDADFCGVNTIREKLTGEDRWGGVEHFKFSDFTVRLLDSYLEHSAWHKRGSGDRKSAENLRGSSFMARSISKASVPQ